VPIKTKIAVLEEKPCPEVEDTPKYEKATLGGGCFWHSEAIYQRLKGVYKVYNGYSGGKTESPTY
jgi:peptide methionine sulfoxide reductase MsrA